MDLATISLIIAIIGKCIEYGAPAVQSLLLALNKDDITLEDIQNLKITKEPGDY